MYFELREAVRLLFVFVFVVFAVGAKRRSRGGVKIRDVSVFDDLRALRGRCMIGRSGDLRACLRCRRGQRFERESALGGGTNGGGCFIFVAVTK